MDYYYNAIKCSFMYSVDRNAEFREYDIIWNSYRIECITEASSR